MSWVRSFSALYRGECPECGERWYPGDPIAFALDILMCLDCAEDVMDEYEWERLNDE